MADHHNPVMPHYDTAKQRQETQDKINAVITENETLKARVAAQVIQINDLITRLNQATQTINALNDENKKLESENQNLLGILEMSDRSVAQMAR